MSIRFGPKAAGRSSSVGFEHISGRARTYSDPASVMNSCWTHIKQIETIIIQVVVARLVIK